MHIFGTDSFPSNGSPARYPHLPAIARAYWPVSRHIHPSFPTLRQATSLGFCLASKDPEASLTTPPPQKSEESPIWFCFLLRHSERILIREKLLEEPRTSVKLQQTKAHHLRQKPHQPAQNAFQPTTTHHFHSETIQSIQSLATYTHS